MSLDRNRNSLGYQLGRLLSLGNWIQAISIGGVGKAREPNCSLADTYRNTLSTTPNMVFGAVSEKIDCHLAKIRRMAKGLYVNLDKEYRQILGKIQDSIGEGNLPDVLDDNQKAEFVLGLHMQRFAKSDSESVKAGSESGDQQTTTSKEAV